MNSFFSLSKSLFKNGLLFVFVFLYVFFCSSSNTRQDTFEQRGESNHLLPRSRRGRGPGQSRLGQQEEVLSLLGQRERRAEQLLQVATGRPARMHSDSLPASQKQVFFRKLFFSSFEESLFLHSLCECVGVRRSERGEVE